MWGESSDIFSFAYKIKLFDPFLVWTGEKRGVRGRTPPPTHNKKLGIKSNYTESERVLKSSLSTHGK